MADTNTLRFTLNKAEYTPGERIILTLEGDYIRTSNVSVETGRITLTLTDGSLVEVDVPPFTVTGGQSRSLAPTLPATFVDSTGRTWTATSARTAEAVA